jgi:hypothetical protein
LNAIFNEGEYDKVVARALKKTSVGEVLTGNLSQKQFMKSRWKDYMAK